MFDAEEIRRGVERVASQVNEHFKGEPLTVICILKGAFLFCADLVRELEGPMKIEFVSLSSYGDKRESSGQVQYLSEINFPIKDQNILVVEDIVDTGLTLHSFLGHIREMGPKSVKVASLLVKPSKMKFPVDTDFVAFEIEDKFVVGYGLDDAQLSRDLPYIGVFE
jgi:hypoxanthine phosphoribosyltransferase